MSGATWLAIAISASLAAIAAAVGWWVWTNLRDVEIGLHGWVALGLGATVTALLGVGLMLLVMKSSRGGYDERVGRE